MLEKHLKYGKLYDYYGEILKKKHKDIVQQYYLQDLSLKEISENLEITRQGVYDLLKRAEKNLERIDNKLNIIEKQGRYKDKLLIKVLSIKENLESSNIKEKNQELEELIRLIKEL